MGWSKKQASDFTKRAKKRAGEGWGLLSHSLKEALVAREFALIMIGQCGETTNTKDAAQLYDDMLDAAGLSQKDACEVGSNG